MFKKTPISAKAINPPPLAGGVGSGVKQKQPSPLSPSLQILYSTRDGQAKKIALYIANHLTTQSRHSRENRNPAASVREPKTLPPQTRRKWIPVFTGMTCEECDLRTYENSALIILIAAVRHGRHLPEAENFLRTYKKTHPNTPLALASVNLTARKPNKDTIQGNIYLRKLIKRYKLSPILVTAFAGRLDYPKYNWFDRQMIRLIMKITGGPTNPKANVEYTDWKKVTAFADQLSKTFFSSPLAGEDRKP